MVSESNPNVISMPKRPGAACDVCLCVCVQPVATNGVRYDRQDSPDYLTLNTQIEEAR